MTNMPDDGGGRGAVRRECEVKMEDWEGEREKNIICVKKIK